MEVESDLQTLIPLIYDTTTSADALPELIAALRRLFRARACGIAVFNFKLFDGALHASIGFRPEFVDSYQKSYARHDLWLRNETTYRVPGTVHVGQELVPDSELLASQFYQEWLKPQGLFYRLSAVLIREQANLCYFVSLRGPADTQFGVDEIRLCRTLAPHLRSAVQMRRQLALLEVERNAALEVLDRLPTAVVLCDQSGAPVIVNGAASEILARSDGLVVRRGKLTTRRQCETDALESLIVGAASTAGGRGDSCGGALSVSRASGSRPLSVFVAPMRASSTVPGHRRIAAALFISDPESVVLTNEERLLQLFGLTRAEGRLAAKIAEGRSLEEAAAMLNITTQTARGYIKRILSKTGTKRQVELVRLLLLSPAYLS
jgi:DNA-binding CsgD family transcriptional regulator/PAS domain-containing protein